MSVDVFGWIVRTGVRISPPPKRGTLGVLLFFRIDMDKRVVLTKEKLKASLLLLLKERPMDGISISLICSTAGINRNTFYSHYQSIGQLMKEIEDEFLSELFEEINKSFSIEVSRSVKDLLIKLLFLVRENSEMCVLLFSKNGDKEFLNRIIERILPSATGMWKDFFNLDQKTAARVYAFIVGGAISIIEQWVQKGCEEPVEEIANFLDMVIINGQSAFLPVTSNS